jgi:glycosyltransferase involved in cell wall biosynthesis
LTIHHGVDPAFSRSGGTGQESLVLCVSTLRAHKNLDRLIHAFARSQPGKRLVIVGTRGPSFADLQKIIDHLGLGYTVELTGWIPHEQLLDLYRRASAIVYPSLFEGFGLPVLEGLASGIPVACSDIPPLREIAGDAAHFFDPRDVAAIANALDRICNDPQLRLDLAAMGPERARHFTWRRTAEATLEALTR